MSEDSTSHAAPAGHVFVSYASQDAAIANDVVESLESAGLKCWIAPRDVKPGAEYADAIVRAINEAKAVVLVMSANAAASAHVGREVERAASKRKPIIAFRTDAAPLSTALEYFLSQSQWIAVPALGLKPALSKLAEAAGSVSPTLATSATSPSLVHTKTAKRVVIAAAILFALAAALVGGFRFWPGTGGDSRQAGVAIADKSIAVLPFVDMSERKDQEYFGDGMAEEILDLLAKIPGLTVIGRTSSFQFKGKNEDLRAIGSKLNAAYVLEGSVRNSGDQVRITAQLINTRNGAREWSETYDRHFGDVLRLQDAIALAVARELQLAVVPADLDSRAALKNAEAYSLMLRGRHAFDRLDKEGLDEAVSLFQQALDRDQTLADAESWLARTQCVLGEFGFEAPQLAYEQSRRMANSALKLDPRNAEAHAVLANIYLEYDWDWAAAEREIQQATMIAPGDPYVRRAGAILSMVLGRWDDGLKQIKSAVAVDPLDPINYSYLESIQDRIGQSSEAEASQRRLLDISPTYAYGHFWLAYLLLQRGNREDALNEVKQETDRGARQCGLSMVSFALGRKEESDAALALCIKENMQTSAYTIAEIYALRGQADEALQWLTRAFTQKDSFLINMKSDTSLLPLNGDPRYQALLKKMNLPE